MWHVNRGRMKWELLLSEDKPLQPPLLVGCSFLIIAARTLKLKLWIVLQLLLPLQTFRHILRYVYIFYELKIKSCKKNNVADGNNEQEGEG